MGREIYALMCPDWRGPSFVLEGTSGAIAYANWRGLKLLEASGPLRNGGRLTIDPPEMHRRFYAQLEQAFASGQDHTSLILRDERAGRWMALRVSIPHGFSRDVLAQQLAGEADSQRIAILEVAAAGGTPDPQALNALARAMGFAPAEEQLILALVLGQSADEIAASRGSSLSTVRQRIKSVLAKAGCRRQSELVGLVRMLCGGAEQ